MAERFSDRFPDYHINWLPKDIKTTIASIEAVVVSGSQRTFKVNEGLFGIAFSLTVPLPSRGTVNDIDIREIEDVFILFSDKVSDLRYCAPLAFSDRPDFPADKLSHLNPLPDYAPANFCLHRGDINEWYSEHTLVEYILRIKEWLRDAAGDRLIKLGLGDFFEATRITNAIGYNVFPVSEFVDFINQNIESPDSRYYAFVWYMIMKDCDQLDAKKIISLKSKGILPIHMLHNVAELSKDINKIKDRSNKLLGSTVGLILFTSRQHVVANYCTQLPKTFSELEALCTSLHLPLKEAIAEYQENNYQSVFFIPVTIAIKRPKLIISQNTDIEFVNFIIHTKPDEQVYILDPNSPVYVLENRAPVTLDLARKLSNFDYEAKKKKTLFVGCGAVGSKVILHLAKSGFNDYDVIDNDKLSPHNLIRHSLLSDSVGKNKAEALVDEINKIYSDEKLINVEFSDKTGNDHLLSPESVSKYHTIIDFTASNSFQMFISDADLTNQTKCIRAEIANNGKLGFIKKEGDNRNPRLDDINLALIDSAIENPILSSWLNDFKLKTKNGAFEFEDISIGVGCNSNTLKLADDVISLHSAFFAMNVKDTIQNTNHEGEVCILHVDGPLNVTSDVLKIAPFYNLKFKNDSNWRLRISRKATELIQQELDKNSPNETGGLLIGKVDVKRRIIHVTRITLASDDSQKLPHFFVRGNKGVPEEVKYIRDKTGDLLDYVGEWHTHPTGSGTPSSTDYKAIHELRSMLDRIPFPTFILIANSNKLSPYIYGPKSIIH